MLVPSPPVFDVFSDALLLLSSVVFRLLGLMCRLATDSMGLNALISAILLGTYFGLAWLLTVRTTTSASVHSICFPLVAAKLPRSRISERKVGKLSGVVPAIPRG